MRELAKTVLRLCCLVFVLPALAAYGLRRLAMGRERAFLAASQVASRWAGPLGGYLRAALLGRLIARMGRDVVISFNSVLTKSEVELGDGVYIGSYCLLGRVCVGRDTLIADHVCIPSGAGQHSIARLDIPIRQQEGQLQTIHIGQDCWIGSGSVVLADVADHCVVAAGSVVVQGVAEYQIVAGNPARPIGDRRTRGEQAPPAGVEALPLNTIGQA